MDKYDEDIAYLTKHPELIATAWNGNCNLFVQRLDTMTQCPSQAIFFDSNSEWTNKIKNLGIPSVNMNLYNFDGPPLEDFPIKVEHLQAFAQAQRIADELELRPKLRRSAESFLNDEEDDEEDNRWGF